jgi:hypothetical protein
VGLFRREHFEHGTVELVPTDVREFLGGPCEINEESYRVRFGRALNPPGYTWGAAHWTFFTPSDKVGLSRGIAFTPILGTLVGTA